MNATHDVSLSPGNGATPAAGFATPRWATWWLSILTILIVSLLVGFTLHSWQVETPQARDGMPAPIAPPAEPPTAAEPGQYVEGPWGRLEIVPIIISPPMEFVWQTEAGGPRGVIWHFPKMSLSQLNEKLIELGLPDSLQSRLRSLAEMNPTIDGYSMRVDRGLVMGLSPEVRARLYVFLHRFKQNTDQVESFRFCGASAEQWFGDAPISPETRRLVAPLVYRHGSFLFFSDLRSVEPLLPSVEERMALVRALSRESTVLLNLKVSPESDIEALVRYWGRGGRDKEVRPILESLSQVGGEQSLDITQLLPPFARQRIYTYPSPQLDDARISRDCFFSALNFFSDPPDERFGKAESTFSTFREDYYRVFGDLQFGDLILYTDHRGELVHAAVYIAANIVFTKNGTTIARPWMFLRLQDMKDFYPRTNDKFTAYFRRRGL